MTTDTELEAERRLLQQRRRRGNIMKFVRGGHQDQLSRMDDFEVWTMLLKMGRTMGRDEVVTMLQDLQVMGYLDFKTDHNEYSGRIELSQIELTAAGLRFMSVMKSNDDIELR